MNRRRIKRHKFNIVKYKYKNFFILFLIVTFLTSLVFIKDNLPTKHYEPPVTINNIPLTVDYLSKDHPFRTNTQRKIKYIVIHETSNANIGSNAKRHNEYIHKNRERQVSWHYTVDDKEIYQHLPDNEIGWHAGDKKKIDGGNVNGIGIEMCVNSDGDFNKTKDNTAQLVAFLLKRYNLTINSVKTHHDFSGKHCPQNILDANDWQNFLNLVQEKLKIL